MLEIPDHVIEKAIRLLEQQLDLATGVAGLISAEHAEAIWSLSCALTALVQADD